MKIYGIGNPLIDILLQVNDDDIAQLGLAKGTMHLIDTDERERILTYLDSRPVEYRCGGSCPNTIIALSHLGAQAAFGGKVGSDKEGDEYVKQLAGLSAASSLSRGSQPTGSSIILITPDTERTMNTFLGANREYSLADLDLDMVRKADYFYFTGYMWDTEDQKEAVLAAIKAAEEAGTQIVFDAADPFAVNRNREEFRTLILNHASILFANREEASILFDEESLEACIDQADELCRTVVIKDGSRGSVVRSPEGEFRIPVNRVKAVDSTGAGDMYAAGYLYGLNRGFGPREAGLCASWLASRIVTVKGAQFSEEEFAIVKAQLEAGAWNFVGA